MWGLQGAGNDSSITYRFVMSSCGQVGVWITKAWYYLPMQQALFAQRTFQVEKKPIDTAEMQYREFLHSILPTINANRAEGGYKPWKFPTLRMFLLNKGYGTQHHQHLQLLWNRCSDAEVPVRAWFARLK